MAGLASKVTTILELLKNCHSITLPRGEMPEKTCNVRKFIRRRTMDSCNQNPQEKCNHLADNFCNLQARLKGEV